MVKGFKLHLVCPRLPRNGARWGIYVKSSVVRGLDTIAGYVTEELGATGPARYKGVALDGDVVNPYSSDTQIAAAASVLEYRK